MAYIPPTNPVDVTWAGEPYYGGGFGRVDASWYETTVHRITPIGFISSSFGTPVFFQQRFLYPVSIGQTSVVSVPLVGDGYMPPAYNHVNASWALEQPYTPPSFNEVNASWVLETPDEIVVAPIGIDSLVVGSHYFDLSIYYIEPRGFLSSMFGFPVLQNTAAGIRAYGIPPTANQVGRPRIDFRVMTLYPIAISPPANQITTEHYIAGFFQFISTSGDGINPGEVGHHTINDALQTIAPYPWGSTTYGTPMVDFHHFVDPVGWESSTFGQHWLAINLQRIIHHSGVADPAGYGLPTIVLREQSIEPIGFSSFVQGAHLVYTRDQHIVVLPYNNSERDPAGYGSPRVNRRDRNVTTFGWSSSRFSWTGHNIRNTARVFAPPGWFSEQVGWDTTVTPWLRNIYPYAFVSSVVGRPIRVRNASPQVLPDGFESTVFGLASIINTRRWIYPYSPFKPDDFGTPWLSPGVRHIHPYTIPAPDSANPSVDYGVRAISPSGIEPPYFPQKHIFSIRFNIIRVRSFNVKQRPWIGDPVVLNVNRTVRPYTYDFLEIGRPTVGLYDREVNAETVGNTLRFGSHLIRDRKHVAYPPSIISSFIPQTHYVWNLVPPGPGPQDIYVSGISPPSYQVSFPVIYNGTIYPQGFDSAVFGRTTVYTAGIWITLGIGNLKQFGTPSLDPRLIISPPSIPADGEGISDHNWGKPTVMPHTIYAPSSDQADEQARLNNPAIGDPHRIDDHLRNSISKDGGWPFFGRPSVFGGYQSPIRPNGIPPMDRYGVPEVSNRIRTVYPNTWKSVRFGFHAVLGGEQIIDLNPFSDGINSYASGNAIVWIYEEPSPYVLPVGIPPAYDGIGTVVELQHRTIYPVSIPRQGNPETWGLPILGWRRTYQAYGQEMTQWGTHRVEYFIRLLFLGGFESLRMNYEDVGGFNKRTRVWIRNPKIRPVGIASTAVVGIPLITDEVRDIYSIGFDSLRTGTPSLVSNFVIYPVGWESSKFGDIDRWEEGKIKPYGTDMLNFGTPSIGSTLISIGWESSFVSVPTLYAGISPSGIEPAGFGAAVITDENGCYSRALSVFSLPTQSVVSEPEVTQL